MIYLLLMEKAFFHFPKYENNWIQIHSTLIGYQDFMETMLGSFRIDAILFTECLIWVGFGLRLDSFGILMNVCIYICVFVCVFIFVQKR